MKKLKHFHVNFKNKTLSFPKDRDMYLLKLEENYNALIFYICYAIFGTCEVSGFLQIMHLKKKQKQGKNLQ